MQFTSSKRHVRSRGNRIRPPRAVVAVTASLVLGSTVTAWVGSADASVPALKLQTVVRTSQWTPSRTITSHAVYTYHPELLTALVATDSTRSGARLKSVSGCGVSWKRVVRANGQPGLTEIWAGKATGKLKGCHVRAVRTSGAFPGQITILGFTGATGVGSSNATSGRGTASVALRTSRVDSIVVAVGSDWDRKASRKLGSGQKLLSQYLAPASNTYWVQSRTHKVSKPSVVTLSVKSPTGDRFNMAAVEILGPKPATASSSSPTSTSTATPSTSKSPSPSASATASSTASHSSTSSPTATSTSTPSATSTPTSTTGACPAGQVRGTSDCLPIPTAPLAAGQTWQVDFDQEFNGTDYDHTKLTPCFDWNYGDCTSTFNNGREHYLPSQVQVSGGAAHLIAAPLNPPYGTNQCNNAPCTYKSGLLSTARPRADNGSAYLYTYKYGYLEASLKLPSTQGFFTAFWTLPADPSYNYPWEEDILEALGNDMHTMHMTHNINNRADYYSPNSSATNGACPDIDYSGAFHRFGLDWEPDHIAFYIDGIKCGQYNNAAQIPNVQMQIILNVMVDNNWERSIGKGLLDPTLTRQLDVDYIRVFQRH